MFRTLLLGFLIPLAAGQQGVLSSGNTALPACAATCQALNSAARACGGADAADAAIWNCFCQSAYLKPLYQSDVGVCDQYCTDATDSQEVSTWYNSNCGNDNGASEHGAAGITTVVVTASPTATSHTTSRSTGTAGPTTTGGSPSSSLGGDSSVSVSNDGQNYTGAWWPTHWKWVVMLIALLVGFLLLAALVIFLKRLHDRRLDKITGGFNAGITERTAGGPPLPPMSQNPHPSGTNNKQPHASSGTLPMMDGGNGQQYNLPARTREAFMPYGYNYTRGESRSTSRSQTMLAAQQQQSEDVRRANRSPLSTAVETPPLDEDAITPEKEVGGKRPRRVLVKERSGGEDRVDDISGVEKGLR